MQTLSLTHIVSKINSLFSTNRNQSTDEEKFSLRVKNLIVANGQTLRDTCNLPHFLVS